MSGRGRSMGLRFVGRSEAFSGSRRWSCSYSGARPRPLFVARPLSKVEHGRRWGRLLRRRDRGVVVREPERSGRLASRNWQCQVWGVSACVAEPPACSGRWCVGLRANRYWGRIHRAGGDLSAVGRELASDRDRDDPAGLAAAVLELAPASVQSPLRFPGDVDDLGSVAALAHLERLADRGPTPVMPRGLDQQPSRVRGPGLGDRPESALGSRGVLARHDPQIGGELVGVIEACPRRRSRRTARALSACRPRAGTAAWRSWARTRS